MNTVFAAITLAGSGGRFVLRMNRQHNENEGKCYCACCFHAISPEGTVVHRFVQRTHGNHIAGDIVKARHAPAQISDSIPYTAPQCGQRE
jgi:hypothetical protein